jgi:hypothetical protein
VKALALALVLVELAGCELEKMDRPGSHNEPTILGSKTAAYDAWNLACHAPDPDYCLQGYSKEISRDGKKLFCALLASCQFIANPCVHGVPVGDPEEIVLCFGVAP